MRKNNYLKRFVILLSCSYFICCNEAWSSVIYGSFENHSTSDHLEYSQIDFKFLSALNDVFWPYNQQEKNIYSFFIQRSYGDFDKREFHAEAVGVGYLHEFENQSSLYLDAGVIFQSNEKTAYSYTLDYKLIKNFFTSSSRLLLRPLFYSQAFPGGFFDNISETSFEQYLKFVPQYGVLKNHVHVPLKINIEKHSSDNIKKELDIKFLLGNVYPNWFWLGPYYNIVVNSKRIDSYWTPEKVTSFGGFGEASIPINLWQFFCSGAYGKVKEDHYDSRPIYNQKIGLRYGSRDVAFADLSIAKIKSGQGASAWSDSQINGSIQWSF